MDERIQRVLDGELSRDELTHAERSELATAESDIRAVLGGIPTDPLPDLAPAVMRRIEQRATARNADAAARSSQTPGLRSSGLRSALGWVWSPRPVSVAWRPAYGLAAAGLLVLFMVTGRGPADVVPGPQQVLTHFVLAAPDARQVTLAGDFTDWQPAHAMTRTGPGVWTVVVPLSPGIHNYAFIVDGERWVPDPNAPAVDDGFGGMNSRLAVLAPDRTEL
jgi:hypothetical protein